MKEYLLNDLLTQGVPEDFENEVNSVNIENRVRLIGDVGGTNVRFAVANQGGEIKAVTKFQRADYPTLVDAANAYIYLLGIEVDEALFAVNTVITDNVPFSGQNDWGYVGVNFAKALGVESVTFFNDLQSHALSIGYLKQSDKQRIFNGLVHNPKGLRVVVGPGTGLGVSFGIYNEHEGKYIYYGSEGGNQIIGAADEYQLSVVSKLLEVLPYARWEDAISGRGIIALYKALYSETRTVEDIMADFARKDPCAENVFTIVCNFLGSFLHNICKAYLPEGGIYITGGIFSRPENLKHLKEATDFYSYHYSEAIYGEMSGYVQNYSIDVVTHFNPGLLGLANYEE